jgi:hypothetical protein
LTLGAFTFTIFQPINKLVYQELIVFGIRLMKTKCFCARAVILCCPGFAAISAPSELDTFFDFGGGRIMGIPAGELLNTK